MIIIKKISVLLLFFLFIICASFIRNNIYIQTSSLSNYIIFIDPGHGGKDNGTSYNEILEDELNMKLSLILFEQIINDGGICYLTRNDDYDLSSMYSKNHKIDDLKKRVRYIDESKCDLFVSLHLNYYSNDNVNGLQTFYQKNNENSKKLAEIMQSHLNVENKKDKKCKLGDYYLLNNTYSTGILIEYGFLSSEYDRKRLLDDKYLYKLAIIIKKGVSEYLYSNSKY